MVLKSVFYLLLISFCIQVDGFSSEKSMLQHWCHEVKQAYIQFRWSGDPCTEIPWKTAGFSVLGRPLVIAEFGDSQAKNTTLVFSMVHGDEVTPLYVAVEFARLLQKERKKLVSSHVIVAPLVNPDGFFHNPKTRMNARGVDLNRNFSTDDWDHRAHSFWKKNRCHPRRYPGKSSASEPETVFQQKLIEKFLPKKIVSFHSPLATMDYDGPGSMWMPHWSVDYIEACEILKKKLKATSGGFFPGSLGNYAGRLGIPTLTVELPSADFRQAQRYWEQVKPSVLQVVEYLVPQVSKKGY